MRKPFIAPLVLLLVAASATAQEPASTAPVEIVEPPIIIDSEASESDLRSGITRFSNNVTIERGPMMVYADEGVVRQVDGEITEIVLTGAPTRWRDTLDDGTVVTGEAQRIQFDVIENVVTLTGSARLEHEQGRYTGDELVYDLDTESLAGRGTNGNRVRVVIEPDAVDPPPQTPEAEPETDPEPPESQPETSAEGAAESVDAEDADASDAEQGESRPEDDEPEEPPVLD